MFECLDKAIDLRQEDMKRHEQARRYPGQCPKSASCRDCRGLGPKFTEVCTNTVQFDAEEQRTGQVWARRLGHQQMGNEMQECIGRIENMDNKQKQALKRQQTDDGNGVQDENGDLSMVGVSLL